MDEILGRTKHYHDNDLKRITRIKINKSLKSQNGLKNEDFENIIGNAYEKLSIEEKKTMPNIRNIQIYNTRQKNFKFDLKNENDDEMLEMYKNTFNNIKFLQYDNKCRRNRIIIFYTLELLKILCNSEIICIDATFFTAPKDFSQLLILHGRFFKKNIPRVRAFMAKKTRIHMLNFSIFLKSKGLQDPKNINIDFEIGLYNSLHKCFPLTKLEGCLFHLSQIIVRYLKPNFINKYKNDQQF
ncbi:hypothetical protein DMUE_4630, partial [Dictyocoela muelleri]